MSSLSWFRKWRREPTRPEIEELLERDRPGGSDLDKLRLLLRRTRRSSARSDRSMIARARRRGVRLDRFDRLREGDVAADVTWDQIDATLRACGASRAAIEVARDLFRGVRPAAPRHDPAAAGGTRPAAPTRPESWTGQICSVLLTDVVDFGARTDQDGKAIREAMYRIVRKAFDEAGISQSHYVFGDRGDGVLVVVSPEVPTKQLVHRFLTRAAEELSRYNATASGGTRFKLRVALHVGPVESDAEGVTGQVIVEAARLIDAQAFKDALAGASAEVCLGLIASDYVYNKVIKQHPGRLAPARYQPITGRVKDHEFTAWIKLAPDPQAGSGQPDL